jgi:bifunctional DNA-binding transcriptional regulator/antitoxin component of YhaV-PrlF toxin-antitoxin module
MATQEISKVGRRGTVVIPAPLRKRFGIKEGSYVVAGAAGLPDKDLPILLAATEAKATHLLTVDKKHFGFLYGETVDGVLITTPGDYLWGRSGQT